MLMCEFCNTKLKLFNLTGDEFTNKKGDLVKTLKCPACNSILYIEIDHCAETKLRIFGVG